MTIGHESGAERSSESLESLRALNADLTEANARLAEAVAARDTFLAVAAHELRNPMTPIVGRVQMLRRMLRKGEVKIQRVEQGLEQIEWLVARYVKRATMLLDVSRITTGMLRLDIAPFEARALLHEVAESFGPIAAHAGSRIGLDLPDRDVVVAADRLALEEVVDNLVSNALKYGDGKPIGLSLVAEASSGLAVIRVRDEGPGISPDNQARIFERFERAVRPGEHRSGFGVGLWIVRQLCEGMGGRVEVTSAQGSGSTFAVSLPLHSPKESG